MTKKRKSIMMLSLWYNFLKFGKLDQHIVEIVVQVFVKMAVKNSGQNVCKMHVNISDKETCVKR